MEQESKNQKFFGTPTMEAKAVSPAPTLLNDQGYESNESTVVNDVLRGYQPLSHLPPGIKGQIVVLEGCNKGQQILLSKAYTTLGRHRDNEIQLNHPSVSSKHAAIYFSESLEWRIEDLGSKNGTLLNGSRVKAFALRSGDKIFIGDTLMQFSVERG